MYFFNYYYYCIMIIIVLYVRFIYNQYNINIVIVNVINNINFEFDRNGKMIGQKILVLFFLFILVFKYYVLS